MSQRRIVRRHSRVTTDLPEEVRREVDRLLLEPGVTYDEIVKHLEGKGHDISRSSLGRYGKDYLASYQQLRMIEDQARGLVSQAGDGLVLEEAASKLFAKEIVRLLIEQNVDIKKIPRLVSDFAKLQASSIMRERFKDELGKRVAKAAEEVTVAAKANGLSDKAAAEIRQKILGIAT